MVYIYRMWTSELFYPVYAAAFSTLIFLLQLAVALWTNRLSEKPREASSTAVLGLGQRFQRHLDSMGGRIIFTFRLARLLVNGALLALSGYTLLSRKYTTSEPNAFLLQIGLLVVYVGVRSSYPHSMLTTLDLRYMLSSCLCCPFSLVTRAGG